MHLSIQRIAALLLVAGPVSLAFAQPLTFGRALDLAQQQSPGLAAGAASVRAAQHETRAAGRLPDPKLTVGVDNYPVSGPMRATLEGDFMTMQKLGVMQEVPNAAKRQARIEAAAASVGVAGSLQQIARWRVRVNAAQAWLARYYLERKLEAFGELSRDSETLLDVLRAQAASGRSEAVETIEQRQELSRLEDRRDEMARDVARATAALRALVGPDAESPIAGEAPDMPIAPDTLRTRLDRHPELLAYVAQQAAAEADLHAAKAEKRPDWSVELAYAKRGPQFGNMVSLQFSVALPFFGATRQDPMIASKTEQRSRIEDEREALRRDRAGELDADLAERQALSRQLQRARQQALPLAEQRVALLTAAFAAGRASLAGVLAARRDLCDLRLRSIDLQGQLAAVTARLYFTYEASPQ